MKIREYHQYETENKDLERWVCNMYPNDKYKANDLIKKMGHYMKKNKIKNTGSIAFHQIRAHALFEIHTTKTK